MHALVDRSIGIVAVDHVGIAVPDLDEAIAWYAENLGLETLHTEDNSDQAVREAMLGAPGDRTGATLVQLLAPSDETSTLAKFLERNGPGLQQIALRVTDVEVTSDALRAKGLRLIYDKPRRGTSDSRVNFVHPKDTGGVLIELVEPAAHEE